MPAAAMSTSINNSFQELRSTDTAGLFADKPAVFFWKERDKLGIFAEDNKEKVPVISPKETG